MTAIDPYEAPDNVDPEVAAVVEEAAPEYTDINLQRRFRFLFGIGIAGLLLMIWLFVLSAAKGDELDSLRSRNETLTKTNESLTATNKSQQVLIDKLATTVDVAIDQGADVPEPEVIAAEVPDAEVSPVETVAPGIPGERGDAGPPGVGEPGAVGAVGAQGRPPTAAEIATAIQIYCSTFECRGADGVDGAKGDPGETVVGPQGQTGNDGASIQGPPGPPGGQGPPGPGPTDEQVAAAVAAYCSVPGNCTVIP